jgi:exopolysaccharide biosynthesis polyprenyl glycosylphosphotransferase
MFRRFSVNFAIFSMVLDGALTLGALVAAVAVRPVLPGELPLLRPLSTPHLPLALYAAVPFLWVAVFFLASVYDPKNVYRAAEEFQRVMVAAAFAALVTAGLLYLTFRDVSRWLFLVFVGLDLILLLGWRVVARIAWGLGEATPVRRRVLIVGAGSVGREVAGMVRAYEWTGLELVGYLDDDHAKAENGLPVLGTLEGATRVVQDKDVDEVVIALPRRAHEQLNQLVTQLHELPVHARVVPDYFALALYRAAVEEFAGIPMIDLRAPALNDVQRLAKRLLDLSLGGLLTLLALPLLGLVALAIKLDSPGPVLFKQQRVGENGRLFTMLKFRSMVCGAEEMQGEVNERDEEGHLIHKKERDPRVTRVGHAIRKFSLDELPQLFNVLRGEMSLVGPRPELPWLVEKYEPWQRKRFAVPQGMTGWWQVNGRSDKPMHLHTEEDLYYVQNYSLLLDLVILWKTIWVVLRGKGAY